MNTTAAKPPLPENARIGEVNKTLHLSRHKLLISYGQKVVQEFDDAFAKSSWRTEYGTNYCLTDQLESELEAMLDEDSPCVECMRIVRLIINHAEHEDCANLVLSE